MVHNSIKSHIDIYTDGSLVRSKNQINCGYGIYFPNGEYKSISRRFTHEPITNNRAELYAILKSIIIANIINEKRIINKQITVKEITIYSDSEYSVKTFNNWLEGWKKSSKDYKNKDIIDMIDEHAKNSPFKIKFVHVRAHSGKNDIYSINNNIVDKLAKNGAFRETK